jgi:alkanesulfonate monooxygenase SsuD/methylene tetrahydromethanopterin reductase-like flavin-dependent oxidoreductase (luciferase family)
VAVTTRNATPIDFRVFVEPQQGSTYSDQLAVARTADGAGYSAFFRSDHYLAMAGDGLPGPTDSWVTLAGLARETSTIRLGTMVTSATFRYPGPLAISVAQVDQMSGGRVEFGIGAGWFEAEHKANAIPFPPLGERFDRLTEQLEILTGLWATPLGETFDYSGKHYSIVDSRHCPSLCRPRIRRSSSAAAAPSGPRPLPPSSPTSSTSRSYRWRRSPRNMTASPPPSRTPDARPIR